MSLAPERLPLIGGSDVASILGRSPWGSAWEVWARVKLGIVNDADSSAMRRGRRFEKAVVDEVATTYAEPVEYQPGMVVHENGWACASPDFLIGADGIGEVKIPGGDQRPSWGEHGDVVADFDNSKIPAHYALQAYWYMHVTGRKFVDFVVAFTSYQDGLADPITIRLLRDEEVQTSIFKAVSEWRDRFVLGDEEPPIGGSDEAKTYLLAKFPGAPEKIRRDATDDEAALLARHRDLGDKIGILEAERDALGNQIRAAMGDAYSLHAGTVTATLSLASQTRRVAGLKDIEKSRPDLATALDAAGLINVTSSRVLKITRKESK